MISSEQAVEILEKYGKKSAWTKHCFAVADLTLKAGLILKRYRPIDCDFLWSAALLHDIGRYKTHDPIIHGIEGYKLLIKMGHEKEANICASHILFGLKAEEAVLFGLPNRDFIPQTIEEKLIPLVDFMIEYDRPTTLDKRFLSLRKRNMENDFFLSRLSRAEKIAKDLLAKIDKEIGKSFENIIL